MLKYMLVVCTTLYCATCRADDEPPEDKSWFLTLGANAYSRNNIHYDIADIITGHTAIRDDNCGYNLSVGYDWDWLAAELALNRVRVSGASAIAITGRVTMPIFPLENLPYIGFEYGVVNVRYSDKEYDISAHDTTTMFGLLIGLRYDITDSVFINAMWQYSIFNLDVNVSDLPIELDIHRQNIVLAVGWRF